MSNRSSAVLAVTFAMAMAVGVSARAQRRGGGRNRIPETSQALEPLKGLACSFPSGPTVNITKINVEEGTAEIGGGFRGGDNVNAKLAGSTLHFLDISLNGGLTVITVFAKETHDGRLQAAFSRAAYVQNGPGATANPEVAQYNGDCEALR